MVRGFSVLKLRLTPEEGRKVLDEDDPIAHLPNLPRVLALDSTGQIHQFRFATSKLLPGDSLLPSEPMRLGEFRDSEIQPLVFIKHLYNEPSLFTMIEEEENQNIVSDNRRPEPEEFRSPEPKNKNQQQPPNNLE